MSDPFDDDNIHHAPRLIRTKAEAIRAGKTHLVAPCPDCGWTARKAISELESIGSEQSLRDIARRLKCSRCGSRADQAKVAWE